ncbi:MAG: leucine-rich repeat domain-containing protein [Candidatus Kapaibacterium sp.]|nr:MAG: leucine-rich repeat domain-containing protein [Candidatus Kapabacteria bacterium]
MNTAITKLLEENKQQQSAELNLTRLGTEDCFPDGTEPEFADLVRFTWVTTLKMQYYKQRFTVIPPLPPNLTRLEIGNGSISDLSPIAHQTSLEHLKLGHIPVSDISVLATLPNLKKLYLNEIPIRDVNSLAGLSRLEMFSYSGKELCDIQALGNLPQLKNLEIWGDYQTLNIAPLAACSALEEIKLFNVTLEHPETLALLTNVRDLRLWENGLKGNIDFTRSLLACEELEIDFNGISDLTPLQGLSALLRFSCRRNEIEDITPLAHLTSLADLDLSGNRIKDISPIKHLSNLTDLGVAHNSISDISVLAEMPHTFDDMFSCVSMSYNQIQDFSPLPGWCYALYIEGNPGVQAMEAILGRSIEFDDNNDNSLRHEDFWDFKKAVNASRSGSF